MASETFLVVVETRADGEVTAATQLKTVVAKSQKAAEQAAIAALAKEDKFEEGMEATAVPFRGLSKA